LRRAPARIAALPGVEGVAQVDKTPLSPGHTQTSFRLPDRAELHDVDVTTVSPGYFSLIRIPIVRGRTFMATELDGPPRAVNVTEATARRYWPGQDPIGRTIVMQLNQDTPLEIVGVARDAQVVQIGQTESSYMYLAGGPQIQRRLALLVRSRTDFAALAAGVRGLIRELDPGLVVRMQRLEQNLEHWRAGSRVMAGLSGSLSLLALALASVGVYDVVFYVVSRRRREVAIRMALGASTRDVQSLILAQTLRPVAIGAAIGIAGAAAASQALKTALFGISPLDPIAFIGAASFLAGIAVAASFVPTREAVNVDPMSTLRNE
jgi:putative ABC transport system permease protein